MKILHAFIALLFVSITAGAQSKTNNVEANFTRLLSQARMTFKMPAGAVKAPIVKNKQLTYQYAVKYPGRGIEIRYAILPKGLPPQHNQAPLNGKPAGPVNDPFDTFSMGVATKVAGGIKDPKMQIGGFDPVQAKKEFGADKVTFWMINLQNNSFGTSYKFCNMVAMHKNNGANAFVFYLANSLKDLTTAFNEIGPYNIYYNLKYKQ
ncbi:hypothetical protein [Mucilaginibacter panaciglaebae]|uniref:Uncharacterized protein n=1 Tax=Mucilaginibacter panaciglaebae TaxID=502331 RepID=A0ABP7WQB9_9SPHI